MDNNRPPLCWYHFGPAEALLDREQIRRLLRLIGSLTDDEMRNRAEFLGRW